MPRILVVTEGADPRVLVNEQVKKCHLDGDAAGQLLERLAWGIQDASEAERMEPPVLAPA